MCLLFGNQRDDAVFETEARRSRGIGPNIMYEASLPNVVTVNSRFVPERWFHSRNQVVNCLAVIFNGDAIDSIEETTLLLLDDVASLHQLQ
jgi:hypothetical protein